jgi:hypothetical protein
VKKIRRSAQPRAPMLDVSARKLERAIEQEKKRLERFWSMLKNVNDQLSFQVFVTRA